MWFQAKGVGLSGSGLRSVSGRRLPRTNRGLFLVTFILVCWAVVLPAGASVGSPPSVPGPISVQSRRPKVRVELPDGTAGLKYLGQITVTRGTAPFTVAVRGLPAGLTASADGAMDAAAKKKMMVRMVSLIFWDNGGGTEGSPAEWHVLSNVGSGGRSGGAMMGGMFTLPIAAGWFSLAEFWWSALWRCHQGP